LRSFDLDPRLGLGKFCNSSVSLPREPCIVVYGNKKAFFDGYFSGERSAWVPWFGIVNRLFSSNCLVPLSPFIPFSPFFYRLYLRLNIIICVFGSRGLDQRSLEPSFLPLLVPRFPLSVLSFHSNDPIFSSHFLPLLFFNSFSLLF